MSKPCLSFDQVQSNCCYISLLLTSYFAIFSCLLMRKLQLQLTHTYSVVSVLILNDATLILGGSPLVVFHFSEIWKQYGIPIRFSCNIALTNLYRHLLLLWMTMLMLFHLQTPNTGSCLHMIHFMWKPPDSTVRYGGEKKTGKLVMTLRLLTIQ